MFDVLDFWLRLGVDGLRLDAVPYLYEREGTNCENLPETHAFLKQLRKHVDEPFPGRMLLAEANQWPEDAIAYFGDGDECHTAFHFPVMPRLFMAHPHGGPLSDRRHPAADAADSRPIASGSIFLRNHDELTLEMVTDEERDYMYRVYAHDRQARINLGIRRRLAPLLGNNRRKIELMNGLLCSLPGTPVIYYGDEIGMGDNIYLGDRNGVRTPMQWSPDRNAGFSRRQSAAAVFAGDHRFGVPVRNGQRRDAAEQSDVAVVVDEAADRAAAALRRLAPRHLELLAPENSKILAFTRDYEEQSVLMVANLSRFSQFVELDLSRFAGRTPVEMFGQTRFPPLGKSPYLLTLAPHCVLLVRAGAGNGRDGAGDACQPRVGRAGRIGRARRAAVGHAEPVAEKFRDDLVARAAPTTLVRRSTSQNPGGPHHRLDSAGQKRAGTICRYLLFLRIDYLEGEGEVYLLPLATAWGHEAERLAETVRPATDRQSEAARDGRARHHLRRRRRPRGGNGPVGIDRPSPPAQGNAGRPDRLVDADPGQCRRNRNRFASLAVPVQPIRSTA